MEGRYHGPGFGDGEGLRALAWSHPGARPNPGLLFERFSGLGPARRPRGGGRGGEDRGEETPEAVELIGAFNERLGGARSGRFKKDAMGGFSLLASWHKRLDRVGQPLKALEPKGKEGSGGRFHHVFEDRHLASPLLVGSGEPHPLDNSLEFHPTVGVPFIPGSALKGLARQWAVLSEQLGDFERSLGLGPGGDAPAARGGLVFFDALPYRQWPVVAADVINVHLREYYGSPAGEGRNPEAVPFESPTPIFLPVVQPRDRDGNPLTFRFRVGSLAGDRTEAVRGLELLLEALSWVGAGARGAVGYGVFEP